MRACVSDFQMKTPAALADALRVLKDSPNEWIPFAGGTDLMVMFEAGILKAGKFLNILPIKEFAGIEVSDDQVKIGSTVTYGDIQNHPVLKKEFPNLCMAGALTGSHAIQNRGTLGGNIANASPAGDSLPALMAYGASIELVSVDGTRRVPYEDFHTGYKKTQRREDELIQAIYLPRKYNAAQHFYRKVGTRAAQAISKVVCAGVADVSAKKIRSIQLSMGSVGPTTIRLKNTEQFLAGKTISADVIEGAKKELLRDIAPIDDIRSTASFRNDVAGNVLAQCLNELAQG